MSEVEAAQDQWGRVTDDGTVYVRTAAGERVVGSWQVGDAEGALAFFRRKYEALELGINLLVTRIQSGVLPPDEAAAAIGRERANVATASAVGDLDGLLRRLDELDAQIAERREQRREERRRQLDEARTVKEGIATEAEELAAGEEWRRGVNRFRELLETWKKLPRLDKATDDQLWRRFSGARTTYTRRRKQHFAALNASREEARQVKEKLVAEAEGLTDSTDWEATTSSYRELMRRWKAAGAAPRDAEDDLWKRFRGAQDKFFTARGAIHAAQDSEARHNAETKEALLAEAEALLPIEDHRAARHTLRDIVLRWEQIGRVPRDSARSLEGRLRKVEDAVRQAEQSEWHGPTPETRARAQDTVTQLQLSIEELEHKAAGARERGDTKAAQEAEKALTVRRSWLAEAEKTLGEIS